jgi:hypothetical protein
MTKPKSISLWHQACHHHYNFEQKMAVLLTEWMKYVVELITN